MKQNVLQTTKWITVWTLAIMFLVSCRKTDPVFDQQSIPNAADLKTAFFNTSVTKDKEILKLADHLKKQDSLFNFLPRFIKKNGIPKWDKVLYKAGQNSNTPPNGNSLSGSTSSTSGGNGDEGLFLIPLQSVDSTEIQSYITAYKHNDSSYSYRLYNKDSLNAVQAVSQESKRNLIKAQAVLGYFEKTINNKESITIEAPMPAKLKNINLNFASGNGSNFGGTNTSSTTGCFEVYYIEIAIEIEIMDPQQNLGNITITIFINIEIYIEVACEDPYEDPYWYDYGTGWPYYYNGGGGYYDPNWQWWWTGGGGNSGGGGGSTNTDGFEIEEFETGNLMNPCIKSVVNSIGQAGAHSLLLKKYQQFLGMTNDKLKFAFEEDNTLTDNNGSPVAARTVVTTGANDVKEIKIKINSNYLQNASKEYIATTVLHELLHTFYVVAYPTSTQHDQHAAMFTTGDCLRIGESLIELFPAIDHNDATALGLQGLEELWLIPNGSGGYDVDAANNTFAENNYGMGLLYARNIGMQHFNGTLGTHC